jgi:hypothetical protein
MSHIAVYLPGLNNERAAPVHKKMLSTWRIFGVHVIYHPMLWSDKQPFSEKIESILKEVDEYIVSGNKVSIIGTSAGASAAINVHASRRNNIHKVVCICGKLRNPNTISYSFAENPAFEQSLEILPKSLDNLSKNDLAKILSLRPLVDGIVPPGDTIIKGSRNSLMPILGHGNGITYALTLGTWRITRFLKS